MSVRLEEDELQALEAAFERALQTGDESQLRILGYGEISTVVAWRSIGGELACKRLPPFSTEDSFEAYRTCVQHYLERLGASGVTPVETAVQLHRDRGGQLLGYCLQPILRAEDLVPARLATADEKEAVALFDRIVQRLRGSVGAQLGIDGQISNWVVRGDELLYLDVSTPLMRDEAGRELLDTSLFLASLPWALRGLVRRFYFRQILDKYYDFRGTVVDLLANLYKEGLERLLPPLVAHANTILTPPPTERELQEYYRSDARMWALLQVLRRIDRSWQRKVRRRTYPFLLPGKIERHV